MGKRAGFLALGGHVANQNRSFRTIMELLGGWEFVGLKNGFKAFKSGEVYPLSPELLDPNYAGFYAGATRDTLLLEDKTPDYKKLAQAAKFVKAAKLDYLIASGGDDHGMQMEVLRHFFEDEGIPCRILVLNKTMDGDIGGKDGEVVLGGYRGPFSHTTNGFHTAIDVGSTIIKYMYSGSWTNQTVTIASHFGRDANWVGLGLSWYSHADLIIPGELPEGHPGYSIERIVELTRRKIEDNEGEYGIRFAVVVVSEGTRIKDIEHVSATLQDPHGNKKLNPELLGIGLKEAFERYGIKSQNVTISYEMRNFPPTEMDLELGSRTGEDIAKAMSNGASGLESVLLFRDGEVVTELFPISLASQKRFSRYHPRAFFNPETFEPLEEIQRYFKPLLGQRGERGELLPRKPQVVNVYQSELKQVA